MNKLNWKSALAPVTLSLLMSSPAMAEGKINDGNYLLANCTIANRYIDGATTETGGDTFRFGLCLGLVEGVRNTMFLIESALDKSRLTCFPENDINNNQATRIVLKYLNDHPADLHLDQTYLAWIAFRDAYKCK